jgi:small neutral amino acid transporter SnatA (MarC family)
MPRIWISLFTILLTLLLALANPVLGQAAPRLENEVQLTQAAPSPRREESGQALRRRDIAQNVVQSTVEDGVTAFNLFIIFFVTLGPLKVIPVFAPLTRHATQAVKRQLAFRSTAISTGVLLIVVLIGRNLMQFWQIQLPALMIAGGLLLFLVALRLVLTQYEPPAQPVIPPEELDPALALSPLAFPTILPPFGIAIALTLMIIATEVGYRPIAVVGLLLLVMAMNLGSMLAVEPILKFIRPVTLRILSFILGVMQFALGIQFIIAAIEIQVLVLQILLRGQ